METNKINYVFATNINKMGVSGIIDVSVNPPMMLCICNESQAEVILPAITDQFSKGFAAWVEDNYTCIKINEKAIAYVNYRAHEVLINGSDLHKTKLVTDYGKTIDDLLEEYKVFIKIKS